MAPQQVPEAEHAFRASVQLLDDSHLDQYRSEGHTQCSFPSSHGDAEHLSFSDLEGALDDDDDEDGESHSDWQKRSFGLHRGVEIFVGGLTRSTRRDMLREWFQHAGEVTEVRIARDKRRRRCRGYGYVRFATSEQANRAIETMHRYQFKHGRFLGVLPSDENRTLFVGGLREEWGRERICQLLKDKMPGLTNVEPIPDREDREKIRTFCFLEFATHAEAAVIYNRYRTDNVDRRRQGRFQSESSVNGSRPETSNTACGIPADTSKMRSASCDPADIHNKAGPVGFNFPLDSYPGQRQSSCRSHGDGDYDLWENVLDDDPGGRCGSRGIVEARGRFCDNEQACTVASLTPSPCMPCADQGALDCESDGSSTGVPLVIDGAVLKVDWADPLRYHIHLNGGIKGPSAPSDRLLSETRPAARSYRTRPPSFGQTAHEWSMHQDLGRGRHEPQSDSRWQDPEYSRVPRPAQQLHYQQRHRSPSSSGHQATGAGGGQPYSSLDFALMRRERSHTMTETSLSVLPPDHAAYRADQAPGVMYERERSRAVSASQVSSVAAGRTTHPYTRAQISDVKARGSLRTHIKPQAMHFPIRHNQRHLDRPSSAGNNYQQRDRWYPPQDSDSGDMNRRTMDSYGTRAYSASPDTGRSLASGAAGLSIFGSAHQLRTANLRSDAPQGLLAGRYRHDSNVVDGSQNQEWTSGAAVCNGTRPAFHRSSDPTAPSASTSPASLTNVQHQHQHVDQHWDSRWSTGDNMHQSGTNHLPGKVACTSQRWSHSLSPSRGTHGTEDVLAGDPRHSAMPPMSTSIGAHPSIPVGGLSVAASDFEVAGCQNMSVEAPPGFAPYDVISAPSTAPTTLGSIGSFDDATRSTRTASNETAEVSAAWNESPTDSFDDHRSGEVGFNFVGSRWKAPAKNAGRSTRFKSETDAASAGRAPVCTVDTNSSISTSSFASGLWGTISTGGIAAGDLSRTFDHASSWPSALLSPNVGDDTWAT